eukprot:Rmarinus@m.8461
MSGNLGSCDDVDRVNETKIIQKRVRLAKLYKKLEVLAPRLGVLLVLTAIVWLHLMPFLSERTYFSENALMPAIVIPEFGNSEASLVLSIATEAAERDSSAHLCSAVNSMVSHSLRTYLYNDSAQIEVEDTLDCDDVASWSPLPDPIAVTCTLEANRRDAMSALMFQTDSHPLNQGILLSLLSHLIGVTWRGHDIIFVVTKDGDDTGIRFVDKYLDSYDGTDSPYRVERSGNIWGGLSFDGRASPSGAVLIDPVGVNGLQPNLDLINVASHQIRVRSLDARLFDCGDYGEAYRSRTKEPKPLELNEYVESVLRGYQRVFEWGSFPMSGERCVSLSDRKQHWPIYGMLHFILSNARGIPTGPHSMMIAHRVDAVGLRFLGNALSADDVLVSGRTSLREDSPITVSLTKTGKTLEGLLRIMNNLLEEFHQSFFMYLLPAPRQYISVLFFSIPLIMLAAAPLILSLYRLVSFLDTSPSSNTGVAWISSSALLSVPRTVGATMKAVSVSHAVIFYTLWTHLSTAAGSSSGVSGAADHSEGFLQLYIPALIFSIAIGFFFVRDNLAAARALHFVALLEVGCLVVATTMINASFAIILSLSVVPWAVASAVSLRRPLFSALAILPSSPLVLLRTWASIYDLTLAGAVYELAYSARDFGEAQYWCLLGVAPAAVCLVLSSCAGVALSKRRVQQ